MKKVEPILTGIRHQLRKGDDMMFSLSMGKNRLQNLIDRSTDSKKLVYVLSLVILITGAGILYSDTGCACHVNNTDLDAPNWSENTHTVTLQITLKESVAPDQAKYLLKSHSEKLLEYRPKSGVLLVNVRPSKSDIARLKKSPYVKWVGYKPSSPEAFNDGARRAVDVHNPGNFSAEGITVGEWDAGCAGNHADINSDVVCEDFAIIRPHSTHVAGTITGSGKIKSRYKGVAPAAKVISYKWPVGSSDGNSSFSSKELFQETEAAVEKHGVEISQNSWGAQTSDGRYTPQAAVYDRLVRKQDYNITVVFAAGNSGPHYTTISRWGSVAKNTITVGAVNSGDKEIAGFSSRGPTADGRLKPEVVAPGAENGSEGIKSTVPQLIYKKDYVGFEGTSMAAPVVTGVLAQSHNYFKEKFGRQPAAATDKALLVQTAKDLGEEGPDYSYGYGLVQADTLVSFIMSNSTSVIRDNVNQTADIYSFNLSKKENLKFTVAWSDRPSNSYSSKLQNSTNNTLVNNLDIVVVGPDGSKYYPWTLNPDEPSLKATKGEDRRNNLLQLEVEGARAGRWMLKVMPENVPEPPQSYTVVGNTPLEKK